MEEEKLWWVTTARKENIPPPLDFGTIAYWSRCFGPASDWLRACAWTWPLPVRTDMEKLSSRLVVIAENSGKTFGISPLR